MPCFLVLFFRVFKCFFISLNDISCFFFSMPTITGLGIYKRKNENTQERKHARVHANTHSYKKTRKHALVQENTHENTQKRTRTRKRPCKQELVQENTHSYTKRVNSLIWRNINQFYFQQQLIICRSDQLEQL